jgi:hypothetical protein
VADPRDSDAERTALEALFDSRSAGVVTEQRQLRWMLRALDLCAPVIERAFPKTIVPDGSRVVTTDKLTQPLLEDLFTHRACAIRLRGFCDSALARRLSSWVLERDDVREWPVKYLDGRTVKADTEYGIGLPMSEGFSSKEKFTQYFMEAVPSIHGLRAASAPGMSPVDRLRLELDEAWPEGAHLRHFRGRCMFAGIARVMRPEASLGKNGICHIDGVPVPNRREGIFSANTYLQVPDSGGELEVWNVAPNWWDVLRNYSAFKRFGVGFAEVENQRIIRAALPAPIRIVPEEGETILINAGRPHAVRGFDRGLRISLQTFIMYEEDSPLALLS